MAFPLTDLKLFNFYRRYIWNQTDFATFQDSLINYPATLLSSLCSNAVLSGFQSNSAAALSVGYLAGVAINSLGNILSVSANGNVTVTNSVKSLIVVRPATASTNNITRPTTPFDTVPLNTEQTASVVAIAGSAGAYPSKAAGDVILFGVTAAGGVITVFDASQCELIGKNSEIKNQQRFNILVGNHRQCNYLDLASAVAAASPGDRILVLDNQALAATVVVSINDVLIEFNPGVVFSAGAATIGFTLSGNGIVLRSGRVTGFTTAVNITGNYCTVDGMRFATNTNDVADSLATSQQVGVISE